jgi:hypothetical protein
MSYRFVDSFRAGAYAPARKLSTNFLEYNNRKMTYNSVVDKDYSSGI